MGADATRAAGFRRSAPAERGYRRPIDLLARIDAALRQEGGETPAPAAFERLLVEGVSALAEAHRSTNEARLDLEWAIDRASDRVAAITRQLRELERESERLRRALDRLLLRYEQVRAPQRPHGR